MKEKKNVLISLAAVVIATAAVVVALLAFRNQISEFCATVKSKLCKKKKTIEIDDEFADYADV